LEDTIFDKVKRYWKLLVFVGLGIVVVAISLPLAMRLVSKSYRVKDLLNEIDTSTDKILVSTSDEAVPIGYTGIASNAVSENEDGNTVYGQGEVTWDLYQDDGTHFSMKCKYYANEAQNISGDTFEEEVANRTAYIVSSEVFLYATDLEDAMYEVILGTDENGRDVAVVNYSFSNGVKMSFKYNSISKTPIEIVKNSSFNKYEVEFASWLMNPSVGVCNSFERNGEYVITIVWGD